MDLASMAKMTDLKRFRPRPRRNGQVNANDYPFFFYRAPPAITKAGSCCMAGKSAREFAFPEPRQNNGFDKNTEFGDNGRLTKTANLANFLQIELP